MVTYEDYSTLDPYDPNAGWIFDNGSSIPSQGLSAVPAPNGSEPRPVKVCQ